MFSENRKSLGVLFSRSDENVMFVDSGGGLDSVGNPFVEKEEPLLAMV